MTRNKGGFGSLLLAGAAAFAYYKYSQMSADQKRNLVGDLKEKGKKFYDENIPENVKSLFNQQSNTTSGVPSNGHTL
jgi:hypothetical protein